MKVEQKHCSTREERFVASLKVLSLQLRGFAGRKSKHLISINVQFVRKPSLNVPVVREQGQEKHLHKTLANLVVPH